MPAFALLSEICLNRYRGQLATLNTFNSNLGWLVGLCLGLVVPLQLLAPAQTSPSLVFLLLCWRLPESPVWLMRRGREEEARQTLAWLRGKKYNIEPEVEEIREVIAKEESNLRQTIIEVFKSRTFLHPLALTCTLSMVQLLSGSDQLETYILVIFRDTGVRSQHLAILYQVIIHLKHSFFPMITV